ncbi:ribosomal protein S8 [Cladochytrium replicatum]|nr:ribosomal protein S8 [Cladochytrium replicatum]
MPPVHNLCSQIQNAFRTNMRRIAVPDTRTNRAVTQILYREGFISAVATGDLAGPYNARSTPPPPLTPDLLPMRRLWVDLKYREGVPVLKKMTPVSKPSRRVNATVPELKAVVAGRSAGALVKPQVLGQTTILDTEYGILELKEALVKNVGGEVLCIAA